MKEKKKNLIIAILSIIIIILITLIVLVTTNTISFNSNSNIDNNKHENNSDVDWSTYLLSLHLLEAKITRIRSIDLGDNENLNKTITISIDELKDLLSELKNKKLFKTYSQGRGGPDRDHLVVAYEYNDERYEFEIYYGSISADKLDDNFKKILNDYNYEEKYAEYKNMEGSFYYYTIDDYSESIFDKYFK